MTSTDLLHAETTGRIINAFFRVYDELGYGFLESVYCSALEIELRRHRLAFRRESAIDVLYLGAPVGRFKADFIVDDKILIEVKASRALDDADRKQLLNNLRATRIELGLLLHFGPKAVFKRMILENSRKNCLEELQ